MNILPIYLSPPPEEAYIHRMSTQSENQTVLPGDQIIAALYSFAKESGYEIKVISRPEMAALKAQSRLNDARAISSGKLTPEEVQEKNDIFPGAISVLDWSPAYA